MSYATAIDMKARFKESELIQLTDFQHDGTISDSVLEAALSDAHAEVDSFIGSRYPLPLATIPENLTRLVCSIARYRLYKDSAPEHVRKLYEDAVGWLKSLANGTVSLGQVVEDEPAVDNVAVVYSRPAVFGDDWSNKF